MSELIINKPGIPRELIEGTSEITKISIAYDHTLVTARRVNDDLIFTFDDGHETVLKDFFVHHSPQSLAGIFGGIDKIAGLDVAMGWNHDAEPPLEGEPAEGDKEGADTGAADGEKTTTGPDGQDVLHDGLAGNAAEKSAEFTEAGEGQPAAEQSGGEQTGSEQANGQTQDSESAPLAEGTSSSPASPPAAQGSYKEWLDIAWTAENGMLPELGSTVKGQLPEIWTGIDKVGGLDVNIPVKNEELEYIPDGVADDYVKPNGIPSLSLSVSGGVAIEAGVGRDADHEVLAGSPMQTYAGSVESASGGSISGRLSASDPDNDALTFGASTQGGNISYAAAGGAVAVHGQHGLLTLQADGNYTYTLLTDHTGLSDRLAEGETAQDTFTLYVSDGKGGTASVPFTVTVTGTNDAPVISFVSGENNGDSATNALTVVENSGIDKATATGRVQGTDADSDNGAGTSTAAGTDNATGLRFALDAAGTVTSVHLDKNGGIVENPDATNYVGIFSVDARTGEYSFTVNNNNADVAKLGIADSGISLTPPVYVLDAHEAMAQTAVHVLIQGKDAHISVTALPSSFTLSLKESGVRGDDSALGIEGNANTAVTGIMTVGGTFSGTVAEGDTLSYTLTWGDTSITVQEGTGMQTLRTYYGSITLKGDGSYSYTLDGNADKLPQGQEIEEKFTITLSSAQYSSETVEREFSVNITGTNDAPVLTLNTNTLSFFENGVGATWENGVFTPVANGTGAAENATFTGTLTGSLSGSFSGADSENDALTYGGCTGTDAPEPSSTDFINAKGEFTTAADSSVTLVGEHGTLKIFAGGTYTYTPTADSESAFNRLNENETVTMDSFTIYVKDEHGSWDSKPVTITLTGANDAPVLAFATTTEAGSSAKHALTVQEDGTQRANGATVATDVDAENGGGTASTASDAHGLHFGFVLNDTLAVSGSNFVQTVWVKWVAGVDGSAGHTEFVAASGTMPNDVLGALAVDGFGKYTFTLNNNSQEVQGLHTNENFALSVPVTVVDDRGASDTQDVHILINGQDDIAKFISDDATTFTVKEQGVYSTTAGGVINGNNKTTEVPDGEPGKLTDKFQLATVTGSFYAEDSDSGDLEKMFFSVKTADVTEDIMATAGSITTVNTTYGQIAITYEGNGKFTYEYTLTARADVLGQGSTSTEVVTLHAKDASGNAVGDIPINITVQGTNDVPVITSITPTTPIPLTAVQATATGKVTAEDKDTYVDAASGKGADQNSLRYFLQDSSNKTATPNIMTGEFGYITLNQSTGEYTYTLTDADKLNKLSGTQAFSETFKVQAVDQLGAKSDATPLTITIKGTDDALVMGNVSGNVLEDGMTAEQGGTAKSCTGTFTATDADTGIAGLSGITGAADIITLQNVTLSTNGDNVPSGVALPQVSSVEFADAGTSLTLEGLYGTLTITGIDNNATDGDAGFSYTYTLFEWLTEGYTGGRTPNQEALFTLFQGKNTDSSLTETFTVSGVSSGKSDAITTGIISINITGTDDAPIMSSHEYFNEHFEKTTITSLPEELNGTIETHVKRGENYTAASVKGKISSTDVDDTQAQLAYGFRVVHYGAHTLAATEIDEGKYTVDGLTFAVPTGATVGDTLAGGYVLVQQQTDGTYTYAGPNGTTLVPLNLPIEMIQDYEGQYGTLHVNADGTYTYTVDPTRAHGIAENEKEEESFIITVKDSHVLQNGASGEDSTTLKIVVHGNANSTGSEDPSLVNLVNSAVVVKEDGEEKDGEIGKTGSGDIAPHDNAANPYTTFFLLKGASVTKDENQIIETGSTTNTANISGILPSTTEDATWTVAGAGISKTNTIVDEYGTLTLNPMNGEYTYTLHETGVVQTLAEGETHVLHYAVGSGNQVGTNASGAAITPTLDDLTSIITITIKGTNDAPEFTQELTNLTVTANAAAEAASGQIYADDVDSDDHGATADAEGSLVYTFSGDTTSYSSSTTVTRYVIYNADTNELEISSADSVPQNSFGTLTLNTSTGKYEFTLNHASSQVQAMRADESISIDVPVIVTDKHGASSEGSFTITIKGDNANPVITGGLTNAVTEDADSTELTGTIKATDVDTGLSGSGDTLTYQAASDADGNLANIVTGTYGTLNINPSTGAYTYQFNNLQWQTLYEGEVQHEYFWITVSDGHGGTAKQQLDITITGKNDAPVLSIKTVLDVTENVSVLSGTVVDSGVASVVDPDILSENNEDTQTFGFKCTSSIVNNAGVVESTSEVTGSTIYVVKLYTAPGDNDNDVFGYYAEESSIPSGKGIYGTLTIDNVGNYSFALNSACADVQALKQGDLDRLEVKVTVADSQNASDERDLVVDIHGKNTAPTVTITQTEAQKVINESSFDSDAGHYILGTVAATDVDSDDANLSYSVSAQWGEDQTDLGALSIKNGELLFTPNDAFFALNDTDQISVTATITVKDDSSVEQGITTEELTFTINGASAARSMSLFSMASLMPEEVNTEGDTLLASGLSCVAELSPMPEAEKFATTSLDIVREGGDGLLADVGDVLFVADDGEMDTLLSGLDALGGAGCAPFTDTAGIEEHTGNPVQPAEVHSSAASAPETAPTPEGADLNTVLVDIPQGGYDEAAVNALVNAGALA